MDNHLVYLYSVTLLLLFCRIMNAMTDSVTNNNYVGDTKISVSIKKLMPTNAH